MSKRIGDLWWVSPPKVVGPLVLFIMAVVVVLVIFFAVTGRYLEGILATTVGIFFLCLTVLDVLGEILGSIRDLRGVLQGREKEDAE
jgi:hypothetical protein